MMFHCTGSIPASSRSSVDLPTPLGPTSPIRSPDDTVSDVVEDDRGAVAMGDVDCVQLHDWPREGKTEGRARAGRAARVIAS